MKLKDVPQDESINKGLTEVCYAVDENGKYVLAESHGWEVKNTAIFQAWEVIAHDIDRILQRVKTGQASPLAYHMAKNLMDSQLLAQYAGLPHWRVKRHLKPGVFNRLKPHLVERYAAIFKITAEELTSVPDAVDQAFIKDLKQNYGD